MSITKLICCVARRKRLAVLKQQRQRMQVARALRNRQQGALVALGRSALIPHGTQRSAYLHKR